MGFWRKWPESRSYVTLLHSFAETSFLHLHHKGGGFLCTGLLWRLGKVMVSVKNEPHRWHSNHFTIANVNILLLPTLRIGFSLKLHGPKASFWLDGEPGTERREGRRFPRLWIRTNKTEELIKLTSASWIRKLSIPPPLNQALPLHVHRLLDTQSPLENCRAPIWHKVQLSEPDCGKPGNKSETVGLLFLLRQLRRWGTVTLDTSQLHEIPDPSTHVS